MSRWERYELEDCEPENFPAVYVMYFDGMPLYVGSTRFLRKRIFQHAVNYRHYCNGILSPWGEFDTFWMKYRKEKQYGESAMAELRLIKKLRNLRNMRHVKAARLPILS